MTNVGVILSGCGVYDGAEIHESVLSLLALDRAGAGIQCLAPNVEQLHVINHLTGEESGETRNVLVESARIARGDIMDLAEASAESLDALVIPGGFGAAKNLCDFAVAGADARPHPEVARLVGEFLEAKKPIAALCIAPALMAAIFREVGLAGEVTIGTDADTAAAISAMGARHVDCPVDEFRVDEANRVITTPVYMLAAGIAEAARGIDAAIAELLRLAD
ncbi:MAG: isoprenoid biosynthesis glyoxalase ElbB [Planctomycetota bacterium]|jgi:enhancing lycopene biosynthesis protein 2|nr:isoprenoid biosynthesis protein ElbB [Planctomycetota bacterium]MDP6370583.1 isoprenoid biosynthesis glyoxalase ElbB [Planctomycetota bacterium]MDP6518830.1 isoprenoid biosynthesis glyoxalase ElbB [Planctomycetota bacterium]MDP6839270.1 isoprenoid biosynthesis glyoxalase ElbB [Planctomycetota bacterium]MDP6954529.1 isoprenoid biosynthesis glyoxalase ElbB [Planctomycetota bacterium]